MDKKINRYIKKIVIEKKILEKTNSLIEEFCINSTVLIFVDFYTFLKNKNQLDEIKARSLNNIKILPIYENSKMLEKIVDENIDETVCFVCGIGDFQCIEFAKNFCKKLKLMCGIVNLYPLKSEIFCDFSPAFVAIEDIEYSKKDYFYSLCNISKYIYLFLENSFLRENKYDDFLCEFKEIILNLENEKIAQSLLKLGLILNKYKLNFFVKNGRINDFQNIFYSESLLLFYKNFNDKIKIYNLQKSKIIGKNYSENELEAYDNINFQIFKKFLISNKKNFSYEINSAFRFFYYIKNKLKKIDFEEYLKVSNYFDVEGAIDVIKKNKNEVFIKNLENFELFNVFA